MIRYIWFLILLILTCCLYNLLLPVIKRGGSVSFIADTDHLHWKTKFPAVTICDTYSHKRVEKKLIEEFPEFANLNYDYRRHIADLTYGRGTCSRSVCSDCGGAMPCHMSWREVVEIVHESCEEMLTECSFNGVFFDCYKEFYMVDSVSGPCFSFNTLQNKSNDGNAFVLNRTTGLGMLSFRLLVDAQVIVHSAEEISYIMSKKFKFDIKTSGVKSANILFSTTQIEIGPLLAEEDIAVRKCRHCNEKPDEPLHTYHVYSYGSCRLARRTYQSFQRCGCVHPARDVSYKDLYCNYTGLNCLVVYDVQRTKFGVNDDAEMNDCLPSCEESQISIIHFAKTPHDGENEKGSLVKLKMSGLPTLKYKKMLMRTKLDLVVTVGGMVGLFFSASILSLVEMIYLMFRPNIRE